MLWPIKRCLRYSTDRFGSCESWFLKCKWRRSEQRLKQVLATLFGISGLLLFAGSARAAGSFDPTPWLDDLKQTQVAVSAKYANLEWLVLEREVDLPGLFLDAESRIEAAQSEADARSAFERLARKFADGHVRFRWPAPQVAKGPSRTSCASLGYDAQMQGNLVAAFIPGYTALARQTPDEFPAGIIQLDGKTIGVIKIRVFTAKGFPELCEAAAAALRIDFAVPCAATCEDRIAQWSVDRMTRDLERQIRIVKDAGAEALLVDIADNGGGTEWAEAVARMLSSMRLRSERIGFVRGEHWTNAFLQKETELLAAAERTKGRDRLFLRGLADQVASRRRIAEQSCDPSPLWTGQKPSCSWLGDAFYASGLMESDDYPGLRQKTWAALVFKPAQFRYEPALWAGPLIVLVDGGTGSAAEQFAAILQDNRAAIIIGAPTGGAGCGHTNGGTPTLLKNSGGMLDLPDCARFRSDGSNEVMGIQPDIIVGVRTSDGPHRQGSRIFSILPEAVHRAMAKAPDQGF